MGRVWLKRAAEQWDEAFPIGNGMLGAMVYGQPLLEHLQVNEDSLWSGGFRDRVNPSAHEHLDTVRKLLMEGRGAEAEDLAKRAMISGLPHMTHYQSLGDVWIDLNRRAIPKKVVHLENGMPLVVPDAPDVSEYERSLDLADAVGSNSYRVDGVPVRTEYFASCPDNVIVYHVTSDMPLTLSVSLSRRVAVAGHSCSYCEGIEAAGEAALRLWGHNGLADGIDFELACRVVAVGGTTTTFGAGVLVEDARDVMVLVCGRTSFRSDNPHEWCMEHLAHVSQTPFEKLRRRAVSDYRTLHDRLTLTFEGDEALECLTTDRRLERVRGGASDPGLIQTYVEFGRYLLISSSRQGSLPATLQGIWNGDYDPAWGSKYTININTEMNYWLAERSGLSDLHMPLFDLLERLVPRGERVAQQIYGARGWCCHHNTDIWGDCAPQDTNTAASVWPMGGAWLCTHINEHWRHSHDRTFAEHLYPVLRGAVLFFMDYLVQDDQGRWLSGPSTSPENFYITEQGCVSLCMAPAMDREILCELFTGFDELSTTLGLDEELRQEVRERLRWLPPLEIGRHGQIVEWLEDYEEADPGHRHISQLYALFPGSQIRIDRTPELAKAAERTLQRRLSKGGGHTGWSKAWIILLYARLGLADKVWDHLQGLLAGATLDNLLDNHPPFQIDGNFGGATAVLESLVRDYGEEVVLLPATPVQLGTGSLAGLHLLCGATLDMDWKDGHVTSAMLHGERDTRVRVAIGAGSPRELSLGGGETIAIV